MLPQMQMVLRVLSFCGAAPATAIAAIFSQAGGTIGRAPGNVLVLDDPGKTVSRTHALIMFREGRFLFADGGSNPTLINGNAVGANRQVMLSSGDQIMIGEYLLEVLIPEDDAEPNAEPMQMPVAVPEMVFPPVTMPGAHLPVADLPPSSQPALSDDLILGQGSLATFRVLGISGQASQPGAALADPLASADILSAGALYGDGETHADPLGLNLFGGLAGGMQPASNAWTQANTAVQGSASDHVSPESEALARHTASRLPAVAIPEGYDALSDQLPQVVILGATTSGQPLVWGAVSLAQPLSPPDADRAGDEQIVQALLRGLGLPGLVTRRSSAELAYLCGAMLREATGGAMALLATRALAMQENRIDTTKRHSPSTNPLKSLADANAALSEMLGTQAIGYMKPVHAYSDAFEDLNAHELSMLAGMRAALSAVLAQVNPGAGGPSSMTQSPEKAEKKNVLE